MTTIERTDRIVFVLNVSDEDAAREWVKGTELYHSDVILSYNVGDYDVIVWADTDAYSLRHADWNGRMLDESNPLVWWHRRKIGG